MKKLFLAWQDPKSRRWFPIGQLSFDGKNYYFVYIQGLLAAQAIANFKLLHSFPQQERIYTSSELFPLFSNRLMGRSRPDYQDYIQWLNIDLHQEDPITILARSEGRKATDTFELFPYPEKNENGTYFFNFFVRGLRYMPQSSVEQVKHLKSQEPLYLTLDIQNPYSSTALLLRTKECHNLGYCPQYLSADINAILKQNPNLINVYIEKINLAPTPIQLRLMCKMILQSDKQFVPFSGKDYQPIIDLSLLSSN